MSAAARLWGGSLTVAVALHLGVGGAAFLWGNSPESDLPAGAFAGEIAAFGGAQATPGAAVAAAAAPPPPEAHEAEAEPPQAEPPPPKPEDAEVALPKPKPAPKPQAKPAPKPKPKPKPAAKPKPVVKAVPKPPVKPAEAPKPVAAPSAAPVQPVAQAAQAPVQTAPAPTEGAAGSPISGRLGAGGSDAGTPLGRYKALVYRALWQKRHYPAVAQRMGYEGEVEVAFTIAADGGIRDVRVTRESGHGALDREAAALLDRVHRFPPFPADLAVADLTFRIVIPFKLS